MITSEPPTWAPALGRIPSGLFIVSARMEDGETGMLASWVQQCSFDPPMVSIAIRNNRPLLDGLKSGVPLAVNILGEGQKALVAHFGKGFELHDPAFEGIDVIREADRAPAILAALATLHCKVAGKHAAGDHVLVLGQVIEGMVYHEGRPTVHIRRNGMNY